MRIHRVFELPVVAGLAALILGATGLAWGQAVCPGDVDGDGEISASDLEALIPIVTDNEALDAITEFRADVNGDGGVEVSDLTELINRIGTHCTVWTPTPTRTGPTRTPTKTPTETRTPTQTRSATPTPTPTQTCIAQQAQFGTINAEIASTDCVRVLNGKPYHVDVYSITGSPGGAIQVQVAATGPTPSSTPLISVVDADDEFGTATGASPIEFAVTTTRPYQVIVALASGGAEAFGLYQLQLAPVVCPPPVRLTLPASVTKTLDGTECPYPTAPVIGGRLDPIDVYTFQVGAVPFNVEIAMQQLSADDDISPAFGVLRPDGTVAVGLDDDLDCTPDGGLACAHVRFLALDRGLYTIIAAGGMGRYSLRVSSPSCQATLLKNIPADSPLICPGQTGPGCAGTLSGDTTQTSCAAPLPIPGISDDAPVDPASPARLYTFVATAGDVISVAMTSDGDAHLYLLGPAPNNPLVTQDDDSLGGDAELAATLVQPGTYTIIAADNHALLPDDSPLQYTLFVQKCPVSGALNPITGFTSPGTFTGADCVGFGGIPFRNYRFPGTAGQFVTATMMSSDVDAFIRIRAPDGSVVENDDDPFESDTTDARANRILPVTGTYFVEVSTSPVYGGIDFTSPSAFAVRAATCPVNTIVPGAVSGAFQDTDCQLTSGQRYDVLTFTPSAVPRMATVVPPSNGCLVALLAEGPQLPDDCATVPFDFQLLSPAPYGLIVAALDASTRVPYVAQLTTSPLMPAWTSRNGVLY